jgi:hypothetical protein
VFTDYGTTTANNQTATHHLTLYSAPSGALVFGAGTVQWSWGLDNTNAWGNSLTDPGSPSPDPNMEQATVNLLGDMGVQPWTLDPALVQALPSTDFTPPTSAITSTQANGNTVTVSGTASDAGGGVVAGVEVSLNGGATWHPATLTTPDAVSVNWTYSGTGPATAIRSRAVDDSGNLEGRARPGGGTSPPGGSSPPPGGHVGGAHSGATTACVRNRKLALRVSAPKGQRLRQVKIAVGRKVLRTLHFGTKGTDHSVLVHLTKLPKKPFTLTITLRTLKGKTIVTHRHYKPCPARKASRALIIFPA